MTQYGLTRLNRRARLGFAIISNLEPDILLLDEVMSVGDHEFKKEI